MSIERELYELTQAINNQVEAMNALVQMNQKILEVLIDVMAGDDPDNQPLRDMEGNPV